MNYVTIDNNDKPWRLCASDPNTTDVADHMSVNAGEAVGKGFKPRQSTPDEEARCKAAHKVSVALGEPYDKFFAIDA